ncbi:MAG: YceD family protein [Legionellaceae bacterium]|nr:YceD family protein [Legionellaceae bacterium]
MKICLSKQPEDEIIGPLVTNISSRLPDFVKTPCDLTYNFKIKKHSGYYVLDLTIEGSILITCQRCLADLEHNYHNQTNIAVCRTDEEAERLMATYECIVSSNNEVDLDEIITDDLHLFCPMKHADINQCEEGAKYLQ